MLQSVIEWLAEHYMAALILAVILLAAQIAVLSLLCAAGAALFSSAFASPISLASAIGSAITVNALLLLLLDRVIFPKAVAKKAETETQELRTEMGTLQADKERAERESGEAKAAATRAQETAQIASSGADRAQGEAFTLRQLAEEAGRKLDWTLVRSGADWIWKKEVPPTLPS